MAVLCSRCGEELIGAVNRCWRCGQAVLASPDSAEAPPICRPPIPELSAPPPLHGVPANRRLAASAAPRAGQRDSLAGHMALAAVVVAMMALPASLLTSWAVLPALLGLAMALQGIRSSRRRLALLALLLCCFTLLFAASRSAVQWYQQHQRQQQLEWESF